jgi:hypothetical protein
LSVELALAIHDPTLVLYGKGIDTVKFAIAVNLPLDQCKLIQLVQQKLGPTWKEFFPSQGRMFMTSAPLLSQTVHDVEEFEFDHHLEGQAAHNLVNEYKVNQPAQPVIVFMTADKEFLDYRDILAGAKLRILAKVDGWKFGNSKWTLRFKAVNVTMLEQGPVVQAAIVDEVASTCSEEPEPLPTAFELPRKKAKQ